MSQLPPGWVSAELAEFADVRLGRQRSPKNHSGTRMRPYLRAANITWNGLDLSDVKEMNFTESESATYELMSGDVLVSEASGSVSEVGKAAIWRGEIDGCCFQNTIIRARSYGASPEYLRYFLFSEARSGRIGNASPGVGIHHIGSRRLSEWPVPVPPLNEQRRIVAAIEERLSRLDAADASLAAALRRLEVVGRSLIASLIGDNWNATQLGEIGDGTRHALAIGPFGSNLKVSDYAESGVPLVFVRNIRSRSFGGAKTRFVTSEKAEQLDAHAVQGGDVLVTKMGDPPGDAAVYPEGAPRAIITADCIKISVNDQFDPRFVALAIETPAARRQVLSLTKGVAQKKVSLARFKTVEIPFLPLEEQRQIVQEVEERLSRIDAMRASIERAQRRSAALRAAILERAFSGELVPQDPTDEPAEALLAHIRADMDTNRVTKGKSKRKLALGKGSKPGS